MCGDFEVAPLEVGNPTDARGAGGQAQAAGGGWVLRLRPQDSTNGVQGAARSHNGVQGSVRSQAGNYGVPGARAGSSSDVVRGVGEGRENILPEQYLSRGTLPPMCRRSRRGRAWGDLHNLPAEVPGLQQRAAAPLPARMGDLQELHTTGSCAATGSCACSHGQLRRRRHWPTSWRRTWATPRSRWR